MTIEQLANKKAACGDIDRVVTRNDGGVYCNAIVIPDSSGATLSDNGCTHNIGNGHTVICLAVRNDGSPKGIEAAIRLAIISLATAK